jgi:hypothetical protein
VRCKLYFAPNAAELIRGYGNLNCTPPLSPAQGAGWDKLTHNHQIAEGDSIAVAINKANSEVDSRTYTYHDDLGNATVQEVDGLPIYCIGDGSQILELE